jgi:hypothetical protein
VLQLIATYWMGETARFGATHGFLSEHSPKLYPGPVARNARMMYSATLAWLCLAAFVGICGMSLGIVYLAPMWKEGLGDEQVLTYIFVVLALFMFWVPTWLWWSGFVKLAGPL